MRTSGRTMVGWWVAGGAWAWKGSVRFVAMDPCASYRAAVHQALPQGRHRRQPLPTCAPGEPGVTHVRRRVIWDIYGRQVRKTDPTWAARRRLLRGRERLSEAQFVRMVQAVRIWAVARRKKSGRCWQPTAWWRGSRGAHIGCTAETAGAPGPTTRTDASPARSRHGGPKFRQATDPRSPTPAHGVHQATVKTSACTAYGFRKDPTAVGSTTSASDPPVILASDGTAAIRIRVAT